VGPTTLAAADFNGDGRFDIAATLADHQNFNSAGIAVLLGNGDGTFRSPLFDSEPASQIEAVDINGDNVTDLVATVDDFTDHTDVRLGNGNGTFQPGIAITRLLFNSIAIADFNRDGKPDLAGSLRTVGVATLLNLSSPPAALSILPGTFATGLLAPNLIASAFGRSLTNLTISPDLNPPPTSVSGVSVTVTDAMGTARLAPLFYISPNQINFLIPPATAVGTAMITVRSETGSSVSGQAMIETLAPSLFTFADSGIAAAYITRVAPDGTQTTEPVISAQGGGIVPIPIDLNAPGQVYLILFGTGLDRAAFTSATVQGVNAQVTYAGPQSQFPGLDQVNVRLPPAAAGTGLASIVVTIDGKQTNTVQVLLR
jgi:uncharacterized protein (TIGR03437 family)